MTNITYQWLFTYLEQLGFEESSPTDSERVFEHSKYGILFAFSMLDDISTDRPVRDADITSVEFRLQQAGVLSGTLTNSGVRLSER